MSRNAIGLLVGLILCLPLAGWARGEKTKVACVGNSVTYGYGLADPATESYPAQLQKLLGDDYEVGNFGKSGATLLRNGHRPYNEQEEFEKALDFAGDIAVIHLGLNDTDPRNWPNFGDEFVGDYLKLIDTLRSVRPSCRVIVARLSPIASSHSRFESGTRDWRLEIQQCIETVARVSHSELIDFEEPLLNMPHLLPDGLHPNAEGAARLARTAYSAITGDYGGLQMSGYYADNMVLQRGKPIKVSGIANSGATISVSLGEGKAMARANNRGRWSAMLPEPVGEGPYVLEITDGTTRLTYRDVLIGEVWLCSGQSNMEFTLRQARGGAQDAAKADCDRIRLFDLKVRWRTDAIEWDSLALDSINHLQYFTPATWQKLSAETAARFSAVGYYFGQMLSDSLGCPIGLICNAVGGSPTEAWIDRQTLEQDFPQILRDWTGNDFIQDWVRSRARQNMGASAPKGQRHPYEPAYLFESAIAPLTDYPLRGVIWYQGESNAHNSDAHSRLFKLLTKSWRRQMQNAEMPFYFVQLSSLNRPSWPRFRDSQRLLLEDIEHTGMVVSTDVGDSLDVHPTQKRPVGERLARWALADTYGFELTPSGPLFKEARFAGDTVWVYFDYGCGLRTADFGPIIGFEVATEEGLYETATAISMGDCLKVWRQNGKQVNHLRYAWQPYTRANLVNADALPASTFSVHREPSPVGETQVSSLSPTPQKGGYAHGVSAIYAGVVGGSLLVAGGANFPQKPAAEGGKKAYYDQIYAATLRPDSILEWKQVGTLPQASAYGATITLSDRLILIGGQTEEGSLSTVYSLTLDQSGKKPTARLTALPSLPVTIDNAAATAITKRNRQGERETTIYVVGGNADGKPSNRIFSFNLNQTEDGWQELSPYPGNPRTQPVVVTAQTAEGEAALYLWGGFAGRTAATEPTLNTDGLCYIPQRDQWTPLAAPTDEAGEEISLGGGAAVALCDTLIACIGGVDKDIFLSALQSPAPDYMLHEPEWYQFNSRLLIYNTLSSQWQTATADHRLARAGAACMVSGSDLIVVGGETKPGIRSTAVTRIETTQ